MNLPKPKVVRCFFEQTFQPPFPAMDLVWDDDAITSTEHVWHFPEGVRFQGSAPQRFGITIHRRANDSYQVRILWNRFCMSWDGLTRVQIMASSLATILQALGTDLWYLLNQSIEEHELAPAA